MSNLVKCKSCNNEIAKGVKKCVHCGKDQRNFIGRHKILTGLVIIIAIVAASTSGKDKPATKETVTTNSSADVTPKAKTKTETKSEPAKAKTKTYSDGKYLVNKDIESGLYKVTLKDSIMKMGYVERAKDLDMGVDSILANIILTGNGYIEILKTDVVVKLQGVEIEPIKIKDLKPAIKKEASDGIYLVGYDLAVGTYKTEVTDTVTKMGYVERSKSVAMNASDIIANEIVQGPGYVKIVKGDFAVRLQGVKITLQK